MHRPEEIIPLRAASDAACAAVGRDPATLGRSASVVVNLPLVQAQGWLRSTVASEQQEPVSQEQIAQMLCNYAQEGLSHVQLWLVPSTIAALEWFAPVLNLLDRGEA